MGNLDLEIIAQLTVVTLTLLAGPVIVFLLSVRKGNL
uniref:Photosystem II reaction center protein Psb30 n=1 Tax=Cyanophora paradoxa TaxID=2762 RepID=PSB30_CYAPA|nr:hypothetical protein CypaCp076 [Cyanophora paradoxa]P48256.1 RecName: Full=Photosystem II reaction center protein Psb30; AltName: Full=Photosystem II reaction center protein Ycf12 [Cyanophora paradoxa]AAA81244.1 ycf12 [Cyanophora paradoxa]